MKVTDKSVVVTGGARGVTVADIDTEWAHKVAMRIGERGIGVGCDVSDPDAMSRLVSTAEDSFGPIDV